MDTGNVHKFDELQILTEAHFLQSMVLNRPYRPLRSTVIFLTQGSITYNEHIQPIEMSAPSIVLLDRDVVYEIIQVSDTIKMQILVFEPSFLVHSNIKLNKLKVYDNLRKQLSRNFKVTDLQMQILLKNLEILSFYLNGSDHIRYIKEIIENYFSVILYHLASLIALNNQDENRKMSRTQQLVYDFFILVSENYLKTKSVQFYAQSLLLSSRHLSAVLKKETGRSANQIIAEYVLNEAKAQLLGTQLSMGEIAKLLQFSDQYAFTHFFKKHLKISPTAYRNMKK
ncbi:helix-turn-helix transcriptional regulator [Sphingobacterium sp. Mn56C]|uniref:helix-turn-helix transcriptional regulator n=1 Tax=Sphingobacterium sp. Mn56C TaxID=3395261 RepID=UPI003BE252FD